MSLGELNRTTIGPFFSVQTCFRTIILLGSFMKKKLHARSPQRRCLEPHTECPVEHYATAALFLSDFFGSMQRKFALHRDAERYLSSSGAIIIGSTLIIVGLPIMSDSLRKSSQNSANLRYFALFSKNLSIQGTSLLYETQLL